MINNVLASLSGQFKTDKNIGDQVSVGDTIGSIFRTGGWNDQHTNFGGSINFIAAAGGQVNKNSTICSVDDGIAMEAMEEKVIPPKQKARKKSTAKEGGEEEGGEEGGEEEGGEEGGEEEGGEETKSKKNRHEEGSK
jgi:hypothetical protein